MYASTFHRRWRNLPCFYFRNLMLQARATSPARVREIHDGKAMVKKIVTYNVNGLRPRVAQHGSLRRLLDALDADIICFQETKLSRQDLSADIIMAEGYEAFISCVRSAVKGRGGYSGVATFCRVTSAFSSREAALPLAAEEGFSGLNHCARNREISNDFVLETPVEVEGLGEITKEELVKLDSEGRCIITDHGHFVLFNIYGPRAEDDDKERVRFKLLFYKILQKRWEHLIALGKRVFIVGDFNIAPASIDRCDAQPGFEKHMFREWLRSMLRDLGGPFFDAFRLKHPDRTEAYTCFSQRIGAEEYNYGSRIDHILISGACFHQHDCLEGHSIFDCHVEECEIMTQFKRGNSDIMSKWKGGRSTKLEGSDHIPVYILFSSIPDLPVHNTPSLAVRYLPEVRGWQQSIVSFLRKEQNSGLQSITNSSSLGNGTDENSSACEIASQDIAKGDKTLTGRTEFFEDENFLNAICKGRNLNQCLNDGSSSSVHNSEEASFVSRSERASLSCSKTTMKKKTRCNLSSQLTIKSFFQQPNNDTGNAKSNSAVTIVDTGNSKDESCNSTEFPRSQHVAEETEKVGLSVRNHCTTSVVQDQDINLTSSLTFEKGNAASLEWQRIQQKMKATLPLCKGHHEPCIPRSVKKGANIGRLFYVCARAQGPASNPEANCGHFQWASLRPKEKRR